MSSGYATMTPRLMVTGPTRAKRFKAWRTSQQPARKYNRVRNAPTVKPETTVIIADRFLAVENAATLHNCPTCGRSAIATHAEFRLMHQH